MLYDERLISVTHAIDKNRSEGNYEMLLLDGDGMSFSLNGVRCYLDGQYLLCLSSADELAEIKGSFTVVRMSFHPAFIDSKLSHERIVSPVYESLRQVNNYPDFRLFTEREGDKNGIVRLSSSEYDAAKLYMERIEKTLAGYEQNGMWSCHARSGIFSLLRITENASLGKQNDDGVEILRYIKDHLGEKITLESLCDRFHMNRSTLTRLVHELTGKTPIAYLLEERLTAVLPDVMFTRVYIEDLARIYGFGEANYFIRAFKKRYGKTPLQYRNDAQTSIFLSVDDQKKPERSISKDYLADRILAFLDGKIGTEEFFRTAAEPVLTKLPESGNDRALEYGTLVEILAYWSYQDFVSIVNTEKLCKDLYGEEREHSTEFLIFQKQTLRDRALALLGRKSQKVSCNFFFAEKKSDYPEESLGAILEEQRASRVEAMSEKHRERFEKIFPQYYTAESVYAMRDHIDYLDKILSGKIPCVVHFSICGEIVITI